MKLALVHRRSITSTEKRPKNLFYAIWNPLHSANVFFIRSPFFLRAKSRGKRTTKYRTRTNFKTFRHRTTTTKKKKLHEEGATGRKKVSFSIWFPQSTNTESIWPTRTTHTSRSNVCSQPNLITFYKKSKQTVIIKIRFILFHFSASHFVSLWPLVAEL